jgi:hypothetical protein
MVVDDKERGFQNRAVPLEARSSARDGIVIMLAEEKTIL